MDFSIIRASNNNMPSSFCEEHMKFHMKDDVIIIVTPDIDGDMLCLCEGDLLGSLV